MLDEARKRDHAANALLGLAFAANAASSPEALIKSGNIEGPGFQLMSRMMRKRKEAEEKAKLEAELAELERQLALEGLRVQTDGSLANWNVETVDQSTETTE